MRGAFTGAVSNKVGRFQSADRGTLFLDEIGEMPLSLQVKLLRALQEKVVVRVGDTRAETIDIRVIAATNRDLEVEMKAGRFREDLYYRLNVVHLHLPPLRDRGDDIVVLARYMVGRYAPEYGGQVRGLTPNAIAAIKRHRWPGNIRELENRIKKAVVLADRALLGPEDLDLSPDDLPSILPLAEAKEKFQRDYINEILILNSGNRTKTARDLGVDPRTIFRHLEKGEGGDGSDPATIRRPKPAGAKASEPRRTAVQIHTTPDSNVRTAPPRARRDPRARRAAGAGTFPAVFRVVSLRPPRLRFIDVSLHHPGRAELSGPAERSRHARPTSPASGPTVRRRSSRFRCRARCRSPRIVTDPTSATTLYYRWALDYPPFTTGIRRSPTRQRSRPSLDGQPIHKLVTELVSAICVNNVSGTHRLELIVADRGFKDSSSRSHARTIISIRSPTRRPRRARALDRHHVVPGHQRLEQSSP